MKLLSGAQTEIEDAADGPVEIKHADGPSAAVLAHLSVARARAQARAQESGLTNAQRGAQKQELALIHLYRWGWASPRAIDEAAGHSRGSYARVLERARLVRIVEIAGSPGTRGYPRNGVLLTRMGLQSALEVLSIEYVRDHHELVLRERMIPSVMQLRHDHLVQLLVLNARHEGFDDYRTPLELGERSRATVKRPDAVLISADTGDWVILECELTLKSVARTEEAVLAALRGCLTARWSGCRVVCGTESILSRYQDLTRVGSKLRHWVGGEVQSVHTMTESDCSRFDVVQLLRD